MYFIILIIVIVVAIFGVRDYIKMNKELRQCPNCKTMVKQKFSLTINDKDFFFENQKGERTRATIYKCENCGNSWSITYTGIDSKSS